jgi:CRP-like cAMP-binding protein
MAKVAASPLFRDCDPAFLNAVCAALVPRLYLPDETIVAAGDVTDTMFFVESGSCHVLASNQTSFAGALGEGHAFGEIAFFCQQPHKVTVRAVGHVDVAVLHLATLEELYRTHTNGALITRGVILILKLNVVFAFVLSVC